VVAGTRLSEGEESGNGCRGGRGGGVLWPFIGAQGGSRGRWSMKGVKAVNIYGC
jgi:hypothetical protein